MARVEVKIWLDEDDDNHLALLDDIARLKHQRKFAPTVRNGINLILDLKAGNTTLLFKLFPFIEAKLMEKVQAKYAGLHEDIRRLEQVVLSMGSQQPTGAAAAPPPKLMTVRGEAVTADAQSKSFSSSLAARFARRQ